MAFHKNLDLLMKITNTTNSKLARFVSLDPSFVSRLRRGTRRPAKNENYIKPVALFLAKQASEDHQIAALGKALNMPLENIPGDTDTLADLIYQWLFDQSLQSPAAIQGFKNTPGLKKAPDHFESNKIETLVFHGIAGKQGAALKFLSLVADNPNPQTLLLFSDEDLEWLTSNRDFIAKWSQLLMQVIAKGNKIQIIHTVSRNFSEMLSAIKQWFPIYMTGAIKPYYYPKKRDGVFQRTLFIAPDTAAVLSGSTGMKIENTASFLFQDKKTILALADEFLNFLSFCRPLMKIFTAAEAGDFFEILWEFEGEDSDTLITTDSLSIITMPSGVFNSILARAKNNSVNSFLSSQENRKIRFGNSLHNHNFTEAIALPDLEKVLQGKIKVSISDMFGDTGLYYTPEEYTCHLENIILLLKKYKNFHITLKTDNDISGIMLYVKEDVGVLMAKTSLPTVMFAINENNLVAAFWSYTVSAIWDYKKTPPDRTEIIARLEETVRKLRAAD